MKFVSGVPDILVNNDFEVTTVQSFDEDEDQVILIIAEYVPQFTRGYRCDMTLNFLLEDRNTPDANSTYNSNINDLLLVHVRKIASVGHIPQFEYIFYK